MHEAGSKWPGNTLLLNRLIQYWQSPQSKLYGAVSIKINVPVHRLLNLLFELGKRLSVQPFRASSEPSVFRSGQETITISSQGSFRCILESASYTFPIG